MDSSDEALCEMLGLNSLENVADDTDDDDAHPLDTSSLVKSHDLTHLYQTQSICMFPKEFSISSARMRRLTDELVWGKVHSDRSYEAIKVLKTSDGSIEERRTLTRLENFVNYHKEWSDLCHGHLADCISALFGAEMVLYKEKLNLKPPGGSGFAPHLDTPSLRVALGPEGPQTFVTVMVAIDNMTSANGCLRACEGEWSEDNHCPLIPPDEDGNPDAGGRAGAIPPEIAQELDFRDILVQGGDIVAFNGWAPHRSSANASPFPRRAVFLTYNPKAQGDFHDRYYQRMDEIRSAFRRSMGLLSSEEKSELDALSTIPKI